MGPIYDIAKAINQACGKTGSRHVGFVGGSGGGFAALLLSTLFPGSLAFVQEPQTKISNYHPRTVQRYFETFWPEWNSSALLDAFPERFDMARHYAALKPDNYVYYTQSAADQFHVTNHFIPFKSAFNLNPDANESAN